MLRHKSFFRLHATLCSFLLYMLRHKNFFWLHAAPCCLDTTNILSYVYASLWRRSCRQKLWKGLADLCHKYGKRKVWSGPVSWKKCTNSWQGCQKLHLQATLPMLLAPFATSIQCECVKNHHFSMILNIAMNSKWPFSRTAPFFGASTMFLGRAESHRWTSHLCIVVFPMRYRATRWPLLQLLRI